VGGGLDWTGAGALEHQRAVEAREGERREMGVALLVPFLSPLVGYSSGERERPAEGGGVCMTFGAGAPELG